MPGLVLKSYQPRFTSFSNPWTSSFFSLIEALIPCETNTFGISSESLANGISSCQTHDWWTASRSHGINVFSIFGAWSWDFSLQLLCPMALPQGSLNFVDFYFFFNFYSARFGLVLWSGTLDFTVDSTNTFNSEFLPEFHGITRNLKEILDEWLLFLFGVTSQWI